KPIYVIIGGFFAIACYNTLEIWFLMLTTFKRRNTLYFWSMLVASVGIMLQEISFSFRVFKLAPDLPMLITVSLGWWMMTTGQSIVLYSRLHLVISDSRKLRWVLAMIAFTFFVLQLPTSVTYIGTNVTPKSRHNVFAAPFNVYKITQLVAFTIQEGVLSGLYVWGFHKSSEPMRMIKGHEIRKILCQMTAVFCLVLGLDVLLVVTESTGHTQLQTTFKPAVYSIKLKVELFVLNNLIMLVQ
ncbi:hypothetical protein M426DRAFT_42300, partial [Hypoxylon sp. CI-4A]